MLLLVILVIAFAQSSAAWKLKTRSRSTFTEIMMTTQGEKIAESIKRDKEKRIAERIQDAGGLRSYLVDELLKDRTEDGDLKPLSQRDPGLEESTSLSPAAKERLRKQKELNETVLKATRSAGMITIASCLALLYLAKEAGLSQ